jgi:ubiquinone/menaquinone biosynthesis C-methylase UbiE
MRPQASYDRPVGDAKTAAARRHFDRWAVSYERDRVSRWLRELQSAALAELELSADDVLLDLGCGTGAAVREAAATVRRAVGVDLSHEMVRHARELASGLVNVEFREVDVSSALPFSDGEFSALLCTTAFHHFPQQSRTIAEIGRVVGPGGRVVIADANREHPAVWLLDWVLRVCQRSHVGLRGPSRLSEDLRAVGFSDLTVHTLLHGGYAVVRGRRA